VVVERVEKIQGVVMKQIIALALLATILLLSGCECMSGLGRDIQHGGHWLEKTATDFGS